MPSGTWQTVPDERHVPGSRLSQPRRRRESGPSCTAAMAFPWQSPEAADSGGSAQSKYQQQAMVHPQPSPGAARLGITVPILTATALLIQRISNAAQSLDFQIDLQAAPILTQRAEALGLDRPGSVSANGHSRMVRCKDGWVALSLARDEDFASLPALTGRSVGTDPWQTVAQHAEGITVATLVAQGRLLALPVAPVPESVGPVRPAIHRWTKWATRRGPISLANLQVVDLSSLWAGPLAARILSQGGAQVTKVEAANRPDGARLQPAFYALLHDAEQVVITPDLSTGPGRAELRAVLESADIVIEASRPRALEQLGLAHHQIDSRPGRVWISITGYGRGNPTGQWVAFGDDGAAAGGLVRRMPDDTPHFVGDAIADPLSGLFAALAAMESLRRGGGELIDVALCRSAAWMASRL